MNFFKKITEHEIFTKVVEIANNQIKEIKQINKSRTE